MVSGKGNIRKILEPLTCEVGSKHLKHSFLCVPEGPIPLAGRDLGVKLGATVHLNKDQVGINGSEHRGATLLGLLSEEPPVPAPVPTHILDQRRPEVWAEEKVG